jgi:hypothetical protein
MDAATQAWLDQEDARVADVIRRHGWYIQYVGGGLCSRPGCDGGHDEGPTFAYTVGLFGLGHPELLIFDVDAHTTHDLLNALGGMIRSGLDLLPGQLITLEGWSYRIIPEEVPNPGDIVFTANRFYRRPDEASVPVLQLTYDDEDGRFPWEAEYDDSALQPRPGSFAAWS